MRDETFPVLDPTHPDGPRRMVPMTDGEIEAYHRIGELPPPSAYVAAVGEAVEQLAERAKVPAWVLNPEKWQTLSRAERRATARHHEREQRRTRRGR